MRCIERQLRMCLACGRATEHVRKREYTGWMDWGCVRCEERERGGGTDAKHSGPDTSAARHLHGADAPKQDRLRGVVSGEGGVGVRG